MLNNDESLKSLQDNYIRIVQCSGGHTGSTLLINLLHGFFRKDEKINWNSESLIETKFITKTHHLNIDEWNFWYNKIFKLYYVVSERKDHKTVDIKYKNKYIYKNILFIDYDEINETKDNTLENICKNIIIKFKNFFPKSIIPDLSDAELFNNVFTRISNMNKKYEEIKDKDFSHLDEFYLLHGGHRNRIHEIN